MYVLYYGCSSRLEISSMLLFGTVRTVAAQTVDTAHDDSLTLAAPCKRNRFVSREHSVMHSFVPSDHQRFFRSSNCYAAVCQHAAGFDSCSPYIIGIPRANIPSNNFHAPHSSVREYFYYRNEKSRAKKFRQTERFFFRFCIREKNEAFQLNHWPAFGIFFYIE